MRSASRTRLIFPDSFANVLAIRPPPGAGATCCKDDEEEQALNAPVELTAASIASGQIERAVPGALHLIGKASVGCTLENLNGSV